MTESERGWLEDREETSTSLWGEGQFQNTESRSGMACAKHRCEVNNNNHKCRSSDQSFAQVSWNSGICSKLWNDGCKEHEGVLQLVGTFLPTICGSTLFRSTNFFALVTEVGLLFSQQRLISHSLKAFSNLRCPCGSMKTETVRWVESRSGVDLGCGFLLLCWMRGGERNDRLHIHILKFETDILIPM